MKCPTTFVGVSGGRAPASLGLRLAPGAYGRIKALSTKRELPPDLKEGAARSANRVPLVPR